MGGRSFRLAGPGRMLRKRCLMRARSSGRTTFRDGKSSSPWGMSTTHIGSQMYLRRQRELEHLQLYAYGSGDACLILRLLHLA